MLAILMCPVGTGYAGPEDGPVTDDHRCRRRHLRSGDAGGCLARRPYEWFGTRRTGADGPTRGPAESTPADGGSGGTGAWARLGRLDVAGALRGGAQSHGRRPAASCWNIRGLDRHPKWRMERIRRLGDDPFSNASDASTLDPGCARLARRACRPIHVRTRHPITTDRSASVMPARRTSLRLVAEPELLRIDSFRPHAPGDT